MSERLKDALGWGGVLLVGVVAFYMTRPPAPRPPLGPTPGPPPTKAPAGPSKASLGAKLKAVEGGLSIAAVYSNTNAERAGLVAGDVILTVAGVAATELKVMLDRLDVLKPGESLVLTVRRADGTQGEVRVTFDAGHAFELDLARSLIARAAEQLVPLARPDGLWPHYQDRERPSVAATALVAYALSRAGDDLPAAHQGALARARARLLEAQAEDGGLADPPEEHPHRTYATSLALLALLGDPASAPARARMAEWLQATQVQETHGFDPIDNRYGGWSYHDTFESARLRTDVSTARYALQALASAGLPDDAPVWDRARLWLDLTQNNTLITTADDPTHASERKLRDGGFAFGPRNSKADSDLVGRSIVVFRSYGSATADGVLARLALDGVDRTGSSGASLAAGEEALAGMRWLARRWDLAKNPGFQGEKNIWPRGVYFYYLAALAEALHRAGVWQVDGRLWAAEIVKQLGTLHASAKDSFVGESKTMHEDSPVLASAFALVVLSAARDRLLLGGGANLEVGAEEHAPRPPEAEALAPPRDAVARGLVVFRAAGCVGCHVDAGGDNGPALVGVAERALLRWRTADAARDGLAAFLRAPDPERALTRRSFSGRMPPVTVPDADLADLVQFLLSRRAGVPVSEAQ